MRAKGPTMKINPRATFLFILVFILFSAVSVQVTKEGLTHWFARGYFAQASRHFDDGDYSKSLEYVLDGVRVTIDSGIRWTIGEHPLMKAQTMLSDGKDLYGALDQCESAKSIIGGYDDEGAVSYLCWRIRAEINPEIWKDPTLPIPTKTATP